MRTFQARKPTAAAHGAARAKPAAARGAPARGDAPDAPAEVVTLSTRRDATPDAADPARADGGGGAGLAPVASSPAQAEGSGASGGVGASVAAPRVKSHKDVPGASELPARKRDLIDEAFAAQAQYAAKAAAASGAPRRDFFTTQASYLLRLPGAVVSEHKRMQMPRAAGTKRPFPRPDLKAGEGMYVPPSSMGAIPGIEVGELFANRVLARLPGMMRPHMAGIDTMMVDGRPVAVAIAHSGGYADDNADPTFEKLTYTGEGACDGLGNKQQKGDQSADKRGNRALAAAAELGSDVRVLVKVQGGFMQTRMQFLYVGLYIAQNFREEAGDNGYRVVRVDLQRKSGQAPLSPEALELLKTAVHSARDTAAKSKKRAAGGDAAPKEEGDDGEAAVARPAAKRACRPAKAEPDGDDDVMDDEACLTALSTPKLVLQVIVRGCAAAIEAAGGAGGESITSLLGQNKTKQAQYVLSQRAVWNAMTVTELIDAGKKAFDVGQAAGVGKAADDAATAALLPMLQAGPPGAAPPARALKAKSTRVRPPRAPRRRPAPAASSDDDVGEDDAPAARGRAAAASLNALSPQAVKVLCEALEIDGGLASTLHPAELLQQVRQARAQKWALMTERQLAALVARACNGEEAEAEIDEWRDGIIAGIQAAKAPKPPGARGRHGRLVPGLLDASLLPSDEEVVSDGDPDFSLSGSAQRGKEAETSLEDGEDDEDDEEEDESFASESEEERALPTRHSARCAGGRFASRKRKPSPSASPSPSPPPAALRRRARRQALAPDEEEPEDAVAAPEPVDQPEAQPEAQPARAARPPLLASAAAAPAEPVFVPKPENPSAAVGAAPGAACKELCKRILSLGAQSEPLTEQEKCALVVRFTPFVPAPPSLSASAEEAAKAQRARDLCASLDADARDALETIELYETNGMGQHIATTVFRPKFLQR